MSSLFKYFISVFLLCSTRCFSLELSDFFEAVEKQNTTEVLRFFDEIGSLDSPSARNLVFEIYSHYTDEFGADLPAEQTPMQDLEYYLQFYSSHTPEKHPSSLCHKRKKGNPTHVSLKNQSPTTQERVPGTMILGGVEVATGALIYIIPLPGARNIGSLLIADGIRRTFNGLEELDKENQQNPQD